MDYAFDIARHDRAAHLRKDDAWRKGDQDIRVMVIGGEHVATRGGEGIRWIALDEAPDGQWLFLGVKDDVRYAAVMVDRVATELEPVSLRTLGPSIASEEASLAVHAVGIARWHQTHNRLPAKCGEVSEAAEAGHVRTPAAARTISRERAGRAVRRRVPLDERERVLRQRRELRIDRAVAGSAQPLAARRVAALAASAAVLAAPGVASGAIGQGVGVAQASQATAVAGALASASGATCFAGCPTIVVSVPTAVAVSFDIAAIVQLLNRPLGPAN